MSNKILITLIIMTLISASIWVGWSITHKDYPYSWDGLEECRMDNRSYAKFFKQHDKLTKELMMDIPDERLMSVIYCYVVMPLDNYIGRDEELLLDTHPQLIKMSYVLERFNGEINNGGFDQYFFNSSGYFIFDTIEYLKLVGADDIALLAEKALSLVNKDKLDRKTFKEMQINRLIDYDSTLDELNQLDNEFYDSSTDIYSLLIKYIRNNINDMN